MAYVRIAIIAWICIQMQTKNESNNDYSFFKSHGAMR